MAEDRSPNLAFRWYLGYELDEATPDHSVLSKARARYGVGVFKRFFEEVVRRRVEAGSVQGERSFADSTLVDANASMQSRVDRDQAKELPRPQEFVETFFEQNPVEGQEDGESVEPKQPSVEQEIRVRRSKRCRTKSNRGRKPSKRKGINRSQVSTTDPDAAVAGRPGMKARLAYKSHFTADGAHRVITAVSVTGADAEDSSQVARLPDEQPLRPAFFCADSRYGTAPIYEDVRRRGIVR